MHSREPGEKKKKERKKCINFNTLLSVHSSGDLWCLVCIYNLLGIFLSLFECVYFPFGKWMRWGSSSFSPPLRIFLFLLPLHSKTYIEKITKNNNSGTRHKAVKKSLDGFLSSSSSSIWSPRRLPYSILLAANALSLLILSLSLSIGPERQEEGERRTLCDGSVSDFYGSVPPFCFFKKREKMKTKQKPVAWFKLQPIFLMHISYSLIHQMME